MMKTSLPLSKVFFAFAFAGLLIGLSHWVRPTLALEQASCPDTSAGERAEDCPWAGAARTLIAEAEAGRSVQQAMSSLLPKLYSQIRNDGARENLKTLWGQSINFDENAKGIIVHPAIIEILAEAFGFPAPKEGNRVVHAGMEHTYGYLFSTLKTPYGFKRARWVQGEIDAGFGLPIGTLGPTPAEGSLLTNVTVFIGSIAFRTEPNEMEVLRKFVREVAPEIRRFKFDKLKPVRLEERVEVPNKKGKIRTVKLFTDFVPFINQPADRSKNSHLLIYTVVDPFFHEAQLISAFPVQSSFVERALNPKDLGKRPLSTRYNAFVEGLSGTTLMGERKIAHQKPVDPQPGE